MQPKRKSILGTVAALFVATVVGVQAQTPAADEPSYRTGFNAAKQLGLDLYGALGNAQQQQIHVEPVALETDMTPSVKPVEYPNDPKPLRLIFISVGFVDLMNHVAHAKAIDKIIQKGYFDRYVASLAQETGEMSLKELPGVSNPKFWSDDVMNEQQSNFNQMVGNVMAIELSHHYLGHYKKYADKLAIVPKGRPTTINNLLTPAEWDDAVRAGARNALDSGCGVEGVEVLYDALDKMPKKPVWSGYFLPDSAKVAKMKKDLDKLSKDFFKGK